MPCAEAEKNNNNNKLSKIEGRAVRPLMLPPSFDTIIEYNNCIVVYNTDNNYTRLKRDNTIVYIVLMLDNLRYSLQWHNTCLYSNLNRIDCGVSKVWKHSWFWQGIALSSIIIKYILGNVLFLSSCTPTLTFPLKLDVGEKR